MLSQTVENALLNYASTGILNVSAAQSDWDALLASSIEANKKYLYRNLSEIVTGIRSHNESIARLAADAHSFKQVVHIYNSFQLSCCDHYGYPILMLTMNPLLPIFLTPIPQEWSRELFGGRLYRILASGLQFFIEGPMPELPGRAIRVYNEELLSIATNELQPYLYEEDSLTLLLCLNAFKGYDMIAFCIY